MTVGAIRAGIRAVLFDLDGTLIDSAPDLAGAANRLRQRHGLAPLPYETLRPMVGSGARGMVGAAFGVVPGDERFNGLRDAFLAEYEANLLRETRLFDGVQSLLAALEAAGVPWGIMTNKVSLYALPIVDGLGLARRASVVVCGDTTPHAKPHPEPLLACARALAIEPAQCVYIGDDLRDMQAGKAAGMTVAAATWGYLGVAEPVDEWDADVVLDSPSDVARWLWPREACTS